MSFPNHNSVDRRASENIKFISTRHDRKFILLDTHNKCEAHARVLSPTFALEFGGYSGCGIHPNYWNLQTLADVMQ